MWAGDIVLLGFSFSTSTSSFFFFTLSSLSVSISDFILLQSEFSGVSILPNRLS